MVNLPAALMFLCTNQEALKGEHQEGHLVTFSTRMRCKLICQTSHRALVLPQHNSDQPTWRIPLVRHLEVIQKESPISHHFMFLDNVVQAKTIECQWNVNLGRQLARQMDRVMFRKQVFHPWLLKLRQRNLTHKHLMKMAKESEQQALAEDIYHQRLKESDCY